MILVFGFGGDRDKSKRAKMLQIALDNSSKIFLTSDNSRSEKFENIIKDAIKGNNQRNITIIEDSLVGYEFEDISIDYGQARSFALNNGINGGYDDVNINVKFSCGARNWTGSVSKDFIQNQNTTVTLVDCFANNQGGCTEVCFQ